MNHSVPYWDMEDNSRSSWKKKSPAPDNELVELLWRNGHVVMQSQSNRKPPPSAAPEPRQEPRLDPSSSPIPDDDGPSSSWFQYPLDDDTLARDFPEFFSGIPMEDTVDADREADAYFSMPPPKFGSTTQKPPPAGLGSSGVVNVLNYYPRPPPPTEDLGSRSGAAVGGGVGESSSGRTVGSSACGSNQADMSNGATDVRGGRRAKDVRMNPVATSSGGSGCSFGRTVGQQSASNQNHKRKGRDGEDSECHSEEADYEPIEANRPSRRSGSTRKSRAAEVHNLSERKRRDRINEKMKALQELIPHCNKSDKASMLDEAIQYLKSLQLQLQIMWMGSGMAPMMFPGIGMGHAPMASINNPVQLARAPLVNHSMRPTAAAGNQMPMCQSPPVLNPMNFPTQMQNAHLPDSYARYVGFPRMQLVPQAMNLYAYGSHIVQQNQTAAAVGSGGNLPTAGIPSEKVQSGQSGEWKIVQF